MKLSLFLTYGVLSESTKTCKPKGQSAIVQLKRENESVSIPDRKMGNTAVFNMANFFNNVLQ